MKFPAFPFHVLFCSATLGAIVTPAPAAEEPLNFVFLFADDLGWNGPACYGSDLHETPNIDRLAARGVRFTGAYSACTVCSPTRASVMTGQYPARLHLTAHIPGQDRPYDELRVPDWNKRLPLEEITIAGALRGAGYATAHLGKWHLAPRGEIDPEPYQPTERGFDLSVVKPPRTRGYRIRKNLVESGEVESPWVTEHLTDEAVAAIDRFQDRPFFLYFAYHTPHTPIQAEEELVAHYEEKLAENPEKYLTHTNATYAAMVHSLDRSVGRLLDELEECGVADRTVVIFTSDNGGLSHRFNSPTGFTDNAPLRRGKGSAYEGGVRVPLIVRWPGVTPAGGECDEPVISNDFYPTLLELAGAEGDADHDADLDGLSLVPLLRDPGASLSREALYWHFPHYHAGGGQPYGAVRAGRYRLVEFYDDEHVELYDVAEDLGENRELSERKPGVARRLRRKLHGWRDAIGAQMPTENPDYDRELAEKMANGVRLREIRKSEKKGSEE